MAKGADRNAVPIPNSHLRMRKRWRWHNALRRSHRLGALQRKQALGVHYEHGSAVAHDCGASILGHLREHAVQRFDDDFDLAEELVDNQAIGS